MIDKIFAESLFAGIVLSMAAYGIGLMVYRRYKFFLFNPLLIAIVLSIALLMLFDVDYSSYENSTKYMNFLLTPATVCLAIPLYEQYKLLKKNFTAIMVGIASGVVTGLATIFLFALLFGLGHYEYVTLLPKSITTAIGIALSEELSGCISITVVSIVITGLFGNIAGEKMCRIFDIEHPVAKGVAIGTSAHVMGTAKAMEMGEIEGAMSSLSIVVAGCMTVVGAIIFSSFI